MCRSDRPDWMIDPRLATPQEWQRFKRDAAEFAHEARGQAVRDLLGGVPRVLGNLWKAYRLRRQRQAAIRELGALDDRMLRDIGLGRSEIPSAICDRERQLAREFGVARPVRTCAGGAPKPGGKPATKALIDRSAA
jgi:uncharacterized protein YjiS (DUF1127 family)